MKLPSLAGHLLCNTSALTLSVAALFTTLQPAAAWTNYDAVYGGGSTLPALTFRQLLDCYAGRTIPGDGYQFSASFDPAVPNPGLLPLGCKSTALAKFDGLYAAVGSGNGQRGFISDDPRQLFRGNPKFPSVRVFPPAKRPPFVDKSDPSATQFASYPYPRIDFTSSDSPLRAVVGNSLKTVSYSAFTPATNWQNTDVIRAGSASLATYSTSAYGAPIQVPALEVPLAIAVNVHDSLYGTKWKIQSALTPNSQAGGAIQLSTAQLCAIFSGTVIDWSDATTRIPFLDQDGVQRTQRFYTDNTNGTLAPRAYTDGPLPIKIVYRADKSGTTFILTNYLANACPLLDPTGTYQYKKIFTGLGIGGATKANLPSDDFRVLIANIRKVKLVDHDDPFEWDSEWTRYGRRWISAMGSAHAALKVGTNAASAGRIGYLSPDYTQPYAKTIFEKVRGLDVSGPAPLTASIQNENQRENGVYHPGQSGAFGSPQNFVPPAPDGAQIAFAQLQAPQFPTTYSEWNVYTQSYPEGTTLGGVSVDGLSQIAIPYQQGAYPITGVTFLEAYSCYADPTATRVTALTNWLAWFFGGSDAGLPPYSPQDSSAAFPGYDPNVALVIRNNGFHELDSGWAGSVLSSYVIPSSANGATTAIAAAGSNVDGCQGVTGGAKAAK